MMDFTYINIKGHPDSSFLLRFIPRHTLNDNSMISLVYFLYDLLLFTTGQKEVVIDTECGGFGDNGSIDWIKTDIDFAIDDESLFSKSYSLVLHDISIDDDIKRVAYMITDSRSYFREISSEISHVGSFSIWQRITCCLRVSQII